MKINPEIMSFAMAHPILSTIIVLGAVAGSAFAVKEVAPVAGKALDYMTANVQNGKPPLGEFGGAVRKKVEQCGDRGDANSTAIPGNPRRCSRFSVSGRTATHKRFPEPEVTAWG